MCKNWRVHRHSCCLRSFKQYISKTSKNVGLKKIQSKNPHMYCIVFYCFIPREIGLNFLIQRFWRYGISPIFRAYLLTIFKGLSAAHWSYMSIAKGALKLSVILHIMNVTTIRTNTIHKFTARWPNDHLFKIHQETSMYFFSKTFLFIYIFELNCKNYFHLTWTNHCLPFKF